MRISAPCWQVRQLSVMTLIAHCTSSAIKVAASSLMAGNLVSFPTETVYGLGADACNASAVSRIYEVKGRPTNHPIIVHISSINNLAKWAKDIPDFAIKLATSFWPGPMTLVLPKTNLAEDLITGGQNNVGVRVPAHTVALSLLKEFEAHGGYGIAAPSANRFGKVSPTSANDVQAELSEYLNPNDLILDGGTSTVGLESTIIDCTKSSPVILRPGAITAVMIYNLLGIQVNNITKNVSHQIRVPGLLESHYSPNAKVLLSGKPSTGDGLIAPSKFSTPEGVIRLISPADNDEYAQTLYQGLRLADKKKIKKVFVIEPIGDGIAVAIRDRLRRAAGK
jgi:L-threonylcarbamoyladenylate synthase